jgi:hypothetical protein
MDDVLIRLHPALREDASGKRNSEIYAINLAIVEALISRRDVAIDPVDEVALGVDLDLDGRLGRALRVAFDARANGETSMRYVGRAGILDAARPFSIAPGSSHWEPTLLHSVRSLDVMSAGVAAAPHERAAIRER